MSRARPEEAIHRAILAYLRLRYPRALVMHAANEMNITGDPRSKAIAQNRAKALGMVPGWPDLMLLLPEGEAVFFEVKAPKGRLTDAQAAVRERLQALGFRVAVVRSVDEAAALLDEWDVDGRAAWQPLGAVAQRIVRKEAARRREKAPAGLTETAHEKDMRDG